MFLAQRHLLFLWIISKHETLLISEIDFIKIRNQNHLFMISIFIQTALWIDTSVLSQRRLKLKSKQLRIDPIDIIDEIHRPSFSKYCFHSAIPKDKNNEKTGSWGRRERVGRKEYSVTSSSVRWTVAKYADLVGPIGCHSLSKLILD